VVDEAEVGCGEEDCEVGDTGVLLLITDVSIFNGLYKYPLFLLLRAFNDEPLTAALEFTWTGCPLVVTVEVFTAETIFSFGVDI
jgi:hypothetical protein